MEEGLGRHTDPETGIVNFTNWRKEVGQQEGADFEGPTQRPRLNSSRGAVLNAMRPLQREQSTMQTESLERQLRLRAELANRMLVPLDAMTDMWDKNPERSNARMSLDYQNLLEGAIGGLEQTEEGRRIINAMPDYSALANLHTVSPTGSAFYEPTRAKEVAELNARLPAPLKLEDFDEDVIRGLADYGRSYADIANKQAIGINQYNWQLKNGIFSNLDPDIFGTAIMKSVNESLPGMLYDTKTPEEVDFIINGYVGGIPDERVQGYVREKLDELGLTNPSDMSEWRDKLESWGTGKPVDRTGVGMTAEMLIWKNMSGSSTLPSSNSVDALKLAKVKDAIARSQNRPAEHVAELFALRRENADPYDISSFSGTVTKNNNETARKANIARSIVRDAQQKAAKGRTAGRRVPDYRALFEDPEDHMAILDDDGLTISPPRLSEMDPNEINNAIDRTERLEKLTNIENEEHNLDIMPRKQIMAELTDYISEGPVLSKMLKDSPIYKHDFNVRGRRPSGTGDRRMDAILAFNSLDENDREQIFSDFITAMGDELPSDADVNSGIRSGYAWNRKSILDFFDIYNPIMEDIDPYVDFIKKGFQPAVDRAGEPVLYGPVPGSVDGWYPELPPLSY
jgi:hypothetical protein